MARDRLALAILALAALPTVAAAYDDDSPYPSPTVPSVEAPRDLEVTPRLRTRVYVDQEWTQGAGLHNGPGSVDRARTTATFGVESRVADAWILGLGARFDYFIYDFENPVAILGVNDRLLRFAHRVTAGPSATYIFNDRWRLTTRFSVGVARENEASVADSLTFGATAFIGWRIFENIRFNVGGTARFSRLFIDSGVPNLLPIAGFEWTGAESWGETQGIRGFGIGIGADGAYVRMSLTDTTAVMLSARYESQAFRLNRRNIVPEGIFSEQRVPVGVQFEWSPADGVYLVAHVDGIPWHRYDVRDKSGNRGNGVVADPTLAGGFGVAFNF
ncbi:MAG: hypothetical protein KC466_04995 [Myxococcales bacterium]|nr:hypothetical protein [Myxococcales bacterium]